MRIILVGILSVLLTAAFVPAGESFTLSPSAKRLYPYAVGATASSVDLYLATAPSNLIFDYAFLGNTWATQTYPTKTAADATYSLDGSAKVKVRWVVQSHTAVMMEYKLTVKSGATTLGTGSRVVTTIPEITTAVDFEFTPGAASLPAGAIVSLKVERRLSPFLGEQAFVMSDRLFQSYLELPVL